MHPHKCTKEDIKAFNVNNKQKIVDFILQKVTGTEKYFQELYGIDDMYCLDYSKLPYVEGDFTSDSFANIQIILA